MFKKLFSNDRIFFTILFVLVLLLFRKAFTIGFFQDDYFFIHHSQVQNIGDFLQMFSPIRTYSYKPLASEFFYFFLGLFNYSRFIGHSVVFTMYFTGLVYLYLVLKSIFKNADLAKLTVLIYAINFTHVFQLYWFATFQEVVVFTSLTASLYYYLQRKILISTVLFIAALLSKETAVLYAPFLILYEMIQQKALLPKEHKKNLLVYVITAGIFYLIYQYSLTYVTVLDNYKIDPTNYKLVINNAIWHLLWALGLPNFMPDVMSSIFAPPLPVFQKYLEDKTTRTYFMLLAVFLPLFFISVVAYFFLDRKKIVKNILFFLLLITCFFLFLGPILFFRHKWMVRLMIPQIFVSIFMATVLFDLIKRSTITKYLASTVIVLYCVLMIVGVSLHESSSVYLLENNIYEKTSNYFKEHKSKIVQYDAIYFQDEKSRDGGETFWGQSKKLKSSLWDQYFVTYYIPEKTMKVYYSFETLKPPKNAYIIKSPIFLR